MQGGLNLCSFIWDTKAAHFTNATKIQAEEGEMVRPWDLNHERLTTLCYDWALVPAHMINRMLFVCTYVSTQLNYRHHHAHT